MTEKATKWPLSCGDIPSPVGDGGAEANGTLHPVLFTYRGESILNTAYCRRVHYGRQAGNREAKEVAGMLVEELAALAVAGGTAVVQAAGMDAWTGFRQAVARWFGRGDTRREHAELERLGQTASALETAGEAELERVCIREEAFWQTRFETLLESLDEREREQSAAELRALIAEYDAQVQAGGNRAYDSTFYGPTAFQVGNSNRQDNRFGPGT